MDGLASSSSLKGDALITQIRKSVERDGFALMRPNGKPGDGPKPSDQEFVLLLGMALSRARGDVAQHHVVQLLTGVARETGRNAPVAVKVPAYLLLLSYANTGEPPEKTEQVIAPRPGVRGQRVFP